MGEVGERHQGIRVGEHLVEAVGEGVVHVFLQGVGY
jgi:hypothetical protein